MSDGVLYGNHRRRFSASTRRRRAADRRAYGQPLPLDVNSFLIRHGGKLMLSDAGSGHAMQPTLGKLPENLRAIGADA